MLKIPPDQTFVVQIIIFVLLWLVLRRWWFQPALRVIRERARRSEGAITEARAVQAEADRLRVEHASALEQTRAEAHREVQDILRRAEAEQRQVIAQANDAAERLLADARSRIAEEVATARRALQEQIQDITRETVRKVIGRAV